MENTQKTTKRPIYFHVSVPEYPENPRVNDYQHASITVFFMRDYIALHIFELKEGTMPYWNTDNKVVFTYQRHYEGSDKGMHAWYAEKIEHVPGATSEDMIQVVTLLRKMEAYREKMSKKGFYSTTDDHVRYRVQLLQNIGAEHVSFSRHETGSHYMHSSCPVNVG